MVLNGGSTIEPIDRQLILFHEIRRLVSKFSPPKRRQRSLPSRTSADRTYRRIRMRKIWLSLQYEFDFEACHTKTVVSVAQPESVARDSASPGERFRSIALKAKSVAAPSRFEQRRALSSSIPSGPVVIKPADLARSREKSSESVVPVQPAVKSGLDSLIEAAAARFGLNPAKLS